MKKYLYALLIFIFAGTTVNAQSTYLIGENTVVFYPTDFDSVANLPSFALLTEPEILGDAPTEWAIKPVFYTANGKKCAKITYDGNADLYGTGEGVGTMRRNGADIIMWNTDNYNYNADNGRRLYQSHPWILGVRNNGTAFGILIDNTWKEQLKLNNPIEIISEGPAFRIIVIERSSPQEVTKALATLTGKMELPPLWALGFQQSRYSYTPESKVKDIANNFRSKKIPCDVIWMDIDYMQDYKVFTFNNSRFPDPAGLNGYLHNNKFRSVWMIDPGIKKENGYFVYDQGKAGNHFVLNSSRQEYNGNVWPGSCAFPDYTRSETQIWWKGLYNNFMATGIDGVWNDMNEPSVFNGPNGSMPENNIHRGGGNLPEGSHLRYHNIYGMLMVKYSREGILEANPTKRPFVLSRSNFLGGQRYAATWTGDNVSSLAHLKLSIPMSINLGLSGQPFSGADIGGYSGNVSADLLAQWMAVGAFYPFSRNHCEKGATDQEPWALGTTTENASRIALQRRYVLMPYLYTLFHEAATNGMPIMRPVFFADEKDISLRNEQSAFMWGNDLLIVPKFASNPSLPKGIWKTISVVGEDSKNDPYQPDLLLRGGSIIPTGRNIESTADFSTDSITLLIALDSNQHASGSLYADAGDGFGYKNNEYLITHFSADIISEDSIQVVCSPVEGGMHIDRTYRTGLITNNGIFYSNWTSDTAFKIYIPKAMSLSIVSPKQNFVFPKYADIIIKVDNQSAAAIAKVEFYYDGVNKIGETLQPPYEHTWDSVPTGMYTLTAKAYSTEGYVFTTEKINIKVGTFGEGKILRQFWDSLPGFRITDLITNKRFPYKPDANNFENNFSEPINVGNNYGSRLVGYLYPPKTGEYRFWIAGDDYCDLYLSSDSTVAKKQKIADIAGWTNAEEWDKFLAQKSQPIQLVAGEKYYIEALHKEDRGGDNLAVAWQYADQPRQIIPGEFLSAYIPPPYIEPVDTTIDIPDTTNEIRSFVLYPNPATDKVIIKLPAATTGKISLIDISGRILLSKDFTVSTNELEIKVSIYSAGIYFIRMQTNAGTVVKKLIVQRR